MTGLNPLIPWCDFNFRIFAIKSKSENFHMKDTGQYITLDKIKTPLGLKF